MSDIQDTPIKSKVDLSKGAIELPDLKETVKKKKVSKKKEVVEEEPATKKISRKDTESFKQVSLFHCN